MASCPILISSPTFATGDSPLSLSELSKSCSPTFAKSSARLGDAAEKLRVMLQTIVEPVILRCKSDQNPRRTAVTSDHDLFVDGQPEVL